MWKKSDKVHSFIEGKIKKFSTMTALLAATSLTLVFLVGGYIYIKSWTPVKSFTAKKINGGVTLDITVSTKVPVTGYFLYGTSDTYPNRKDIDGEILEERDVQISHVLPGKVHYVNFIMRTLEGEVYETGFIRVR